MNQLLRGIVGIVPLVGRRPQVMPSFSTGWFLVLCYVPYFPLIGLIRGQAFDEIFMCGEFWDV